MVHNHSHEEQHGKRSNIGLAFFLNLSFTIIEPIGGFLTNSVAVLSDAVHDFGDSLSLALAWYFQKISKKRYTKKYSYSYKRFSLGIQHITIEFEFPSEGCLFENCVKKLN